MRLLIRWLITSAALIIAAWLVPGIDIVGSSGWVAVLIMAAVLGLANAFIRPLLTLLSCPLGLLTLGASSPSCSRSCCPTSRSVAWRTARPEMRLALTDQQLAQFGAAEERQCVGVGPELERKDRADGTVFRS